MLTTEQLHEIRERAVAFISKMDDEHKGEWWSNDPASLATVLVRFAELEADRDH